MAAFVTILFAHAVQAADDFTELLAKLPPSANTIVMVNAAQMFSSEVATGAGWKQKYDAAYTASPLLPVSARRVRVLLAVSGQTWGLSVRWRL